jgi:hypothetical protein
MGNHYHLLVETPEPNLSRGMHRLNGLYGQRFNRRHERVGHVFQGRFKGILVEKQSHLLELVRYVVLNPVRAGLVASAAEWEWSSYCATAGLAARPDWLRVDWVLSQFGEEPTNCLAYRHFVTQEGSRPYQPWKQLWGQLYLGSEEFRRGVAAGVEAIARSPEIPATQTSPARPRLSDLVAAAVAEFGVPEEELRIRRHRPVRLAVAYLARKDAGLRLSEFAPSLGIRDWTASHLVAEAERRWENDRSFREKLQRIQMSMGKLTERQT